MTLGINGLGRMGRTILRLALYRGHTITILNDIAKWDILAYLINFDSTHGGISNEQNMLGLQYSAYNDYHSITKESDFYENYCEIVTHNNNEMLKVVYRDYKGNLHEQLIAISNHTQPQDIDFSITKQSQHKILELVNPHNLHNITHEMTKDSLNHVVDIMIESSGKFLESRYLTHYIVNGAKKVILCAPSKDNTPTFVLGVNHWEYKNENIISNASCTTNCIAPICYILDKHYGIKSATMTTIHSYTNDQNLLDNAHRSDKRRSRSAPNNIIPTTTGAAIGLQKVLPNMKDKIHGQSLRVPVLDVSMADLCFYLNQDVSLDSIHTLLYAYSEDSMRGILSLDTHQRVSSDFLGSSYSSVIATDLSIKIGNMVKLMSWYDNESGYANRILDMAEFIQTSHKSHLYLNQN